MIIDSHVHVWTDDLQRYPIADDYAVEEMQPPTFTPEELLAHCQHSGVERIVLVQMSFYGTDNSYMLEAMRRYPGVFGGIAVVEPTAAYPPAPSLSREGESEVAGGVEREMERLGRLGVMGFRLQPQDGSFDGFARMFAHGAKTGQAMCCLMNPDALPALDRMCDAYPQTPVVIDHLCRIGVTGTIEESEVAVLCAMARHEQVKVKVSAFYALGRKRPPHDDLLPLIERVYEAFGARRLMWASDCPYQVQTETYEDGLALVRDRVAWKSEEDRGWVLGRTAEELFF